MMAMRIFTTTNQTKAGDQTVKTSSSSTWTEGGLA